MPPLRFPKIHVSDERYESRAVFDADNDGVLDILSGAYWYPGPTFHGKYPVDPFNSQYHDRIWVDIDGDGDGELVTGKRYRAHCGHDPGEYDPYGLYYFKWTGENFVKIPIGLGPLRQAKGCGICFQVIDLDADGRLDIVCAGKDGLALFKNLGYAENME